jgi:RNA-dependent RNA polymerase
MRERTRLKLPKNSARNMIGIVDEYGILEYGQGNYILFNKINLILFLFIVFIQYTELTGEYLNNTDSEKTVILQQKVLVTKNPCYHPGDIRVFEAIDEPRLRHLKDVIVFPQRGDRPHPNEISGSDLDGN